MLQALPSLVTMSSLVSASTALVALVMAPSSAARDVVVAGCVAWSMVADGVDGALARRLRAETTLGAQLDSLCDLTAFGVVPALWLVGRHGIALGAVVVVPAVMWIVAAAFRVARFADDGARRAGTFGPAFSGVPTPVAAAGLVSAVAVGTVLAQPLVEVGALILGLVLMPSRVAYPKAGIGRWPWVLAVPLAVVVLARHAWS
jgi:CDP-diacylglycerol--serine O-phosphatidyltransferase